MSEKIERREWKLILLCAVVYFSNYACRYNFAASLAAMIEGLDTTKTLISIALTGNAIVYGAGQLFCGILGDKIAPRYFISIGLIGSALCNLLIGMTSAVPAIWVLFTLNGLVQAMIWPALVRVMTEQLSKRAYMVAAPAVSYACNFSTFAIYLCLVPLCLNFASWRMAFFIPAVFTALIGVLWFILLPLLSNTEAKKDAQTVTEVAPQKESGFLRACLRAGLPFVFICVLLQGILRDGISEWMPSLIIETYGLDNSSAVVTAAILPAFSVLCVFITAKIYKKLKNEQTAALLLWAPSVLSAAILYFFYQGSAVTAIATMALLNASMHGINHLLTARISPYFARYGRVSTVTGAINCFPYIGSAIAAPLSAVLSDFFDWGAVILMWLSVAILGFLFTLLHLPKHTRFIKENN